MIAQRFTQISGRRVFAPRPISLTSTRLSAPALITACKPFTQSSGNPKRPWRRSLRHPQSPTRRPPRLPPPNNIPNPNTLDSLRPKPHYGLPPLRRLLHVRRRLPHFARIRMASRIVGARGFVRGITDRREGVAEIRGGATVYFS
ncbi:MAG: hypothetical protein Q9204_008301 [Flavoplaca sp. TL-2023a]